MKLVEVDTQNEAGELEAGRLSYFSAIRNIDKQTKMSMFWHGCQRRNNIFSLTFWVYCLARIFGFWPFSVKFNAKNRLSEVKVGAFDVAWFVLSLAFYSACFRLTTYNPFDVMEISFTEFVLNQLTQVFNLIIIILNIILDMVNRHVLWGIILKFKAFDDEMMAMGKMLNFRRHKIGMLASIFGIIVTTLILVAISVKLYENLLDTTSAITILLMILITVIIGAHTTKIIIYLFLLLNVRMRFGQLNECLE